MNLLRRMMYMGLGAFLVLAFVAGGAFVFAQNDDDAGAQAQDADESFEEEAGEEESGVPPSRAWRFHERGAQLGGDGQELLADALGITVEELDEARSEARAARLDALVESDVLTQKQADLIAAREAVREHLDVESLAQMMQNAYKEAIDAALEAGDITQEQADQLLENAPSFGRFHFGGPPRHHFRGGPGGEIFLPGA